MMVSPDDSCVGEAGQVVPMFGRHCSIVLCWQCVTCKEILKFKVRKSVETVISFNVREIQYTNERSS